MLALRYSICMCVAGALALGMPAHPAAAATKYAVLHSFGGQANSDGDTPIPELVADKSGNLYGTTEYGGATNVGTVFRLTKTGKNWTATVLHSFSGTDGSNPQGGLLLGPSGLLYGTTYMGAGFNSGTVFSIDTSGGSFTTLHTFNFSTEGYFSMAGLAAGANGLLYGTTSSGGSPNAGTIFSINSQDNSVALLHNFGNGTDGKIPYYGRLAANKKGVLFGTTFNGGGTNGNGIVFELSPPKKTLDWKETVLHSFGGLGSNDGELPHQGVVLGDGGVVYGCAPGGSHGSGVVFELSPPAHGKNWSETMLYNFGDASGDPVAGECAITLDKSGALFGTTGQGGANGGGTVFELDPPASGQTAWTETVLHSFGPSSASEGIRPFSAPVKSGKYWYGVTTLGGSANKGTVYQLKP
jgi:uncharacterized repeat protein (TIGR03803 family)